MTVRLKAPNGKQIKWTSEIIPGTADCEVFRDETGKVVVDYDGTDGTEACWDAGETETRDGQIVFVDDDGNEWLESELVPEDQECDPEYKRPEKPAPVPEKHRVWIRWGSLAKQPATLYEFDTVAELNAFLLGCDEGNGWMDFSQYDSQEEADEDDEDDGDEDEERLLDVRYRCPDCGHEWEERYSSACDSECDDCGAKSITALMWKDADEDWSTKQESEWAQAEESEG
jgi:hypothetical protein